MVIHFNFELNHNKVNWDPLIRDESIVAQIEGRFEIRLDNDVFFRDDYLCLLELGIQLTEWVDAIATDDRPDMNYDAMDHDEPILQFRYRGEDEWRLDSIWQQFEAGDVISTSALTMAIKHFLTGLDEALDGTYGVVIQNFSRRSPARESGAVGGT